ncbi:MAG: transposase [Lysobacter sp.]|nr:transposase [Lysobacter sp.]
MQSIVNTVSMKSGYQRLRAGRWSANGHIYFVTFNTYDRRKLFSDPAIATDAARLIHETGQRLDGAVIAWVLMPDHFHGLIEVGTGISLSAYVGRLKGAVSRRLRLLHPHLPVVWQDGFHDRAIRGAESIDSVACYLLMNPIRAGLVADFSHYPYWHCAWPVPNISMAAIDPFADSSSRG